MIKRMCIVACLVPVMAVVAGAGVFTPPEISGVRTWLDASAITGKVNGDRVHQWEDSSANNQDMFTMYYYYSNSAIRSPRYVTNQLGGRPILRLDPYEADGDARDWMGTFNPYNKPIGTLDLVQPVTLIMMYNRLEPATTWAPTWGFSSDQCMYTAGKVCSDLSPYPTWISAAQVIGSWSLDTLTFEGTATTSHLYRNGAQIGTGTINAVLDELCVGGKSNASTNAQVDVAEILAYTRVLNSAEKNAIEFYEEMKYGLATSSAGVMLTSTPPANTYTSGGTLSTTVQELDLVDAALGTIQIDSSLTTGGVLSLYLDLESTSGPLDPGALQTWLEGLSNSGQFYSVQAGSGDLELIVSFDSVSSAAPLTFNYDTASATIQVDRISLIPEPGTAVLLGLGAVAVLLRRSRSN